MLNEVLTWIGNIILLGMGPALLSYMVIYARWSNWRANALGVERMFKTGSLFLMWAVIMFGTYLPPEFDIFRAIFRILVFGLVLTAFVLQTINLRIIQSGSTRPLFYDRFTYKGRAARKRQQKHL